MQTFIVELFNDFVIVTYSGDTAYYSEYEIDAEISSSEEEEESSDDDDCGVESLLQDKDAMHLYKEYCLNNRKEVAHTQVAGDNSLKNDWKLVTSEECRENVDLNKMELDASEMAYFDEWRRDHGPKRDPQFSQFQKECRKRPRCILRFITATGDEGEEEEKTPSDVDVGASQAGIKLAYMSKNAIGVNGASPNECIKNMERFGGENDSLTHSPKSRSPKEERTELLATSSKEKRDAKDASQPLWYHSHDIENTRPSAVSVCQNCKSQRHFEFQIMPALISLRKTHHDFGTVAVYTCDANCSLSQSSHDAYIEEYVYVQKEA